MGNTILNFFLFALTFESVFSQCTLNDLLKGNRCIQITNYCDRVMWPVIRGQNRHLFNSTPTDYGFLMAPSAAYKVVVPGTWDYIQIWGRTHCDVDFGCYTGSCGNHINCTAGSGPELPVTMAELWPSSTILKPDQYRVNVHTGFNVPMNITTFLIPGVIPESETGNEPIASQKAYDLPPLQSICGIAGQCKINLSNSLECPQELQVFVRDLCVGCMSPCQAFQTDEACCRGAYNNTQTCLKSANSTAYENFYRNACPTSMYSPFDHVTYSCNYVLKRIFNIDLCLPGG